MFKDHPESFDNKLRNYELGIIKSASPLDLDRCEDYYLEYTKAHLSLNRYKVTQKWQAFAFILLSFWLLPWSGFIYSKTAPVYNFLSVDIDLSLVF